MTIDNEIALSPPSTKTGDLEGLETADLDEAAAVAVAIGAHLRDQELAAVAATNGDTNTWVGRRWAYASRLARNRDRAVRIDDRTPTDPWTAAARTDRM